MNAGSDGLRIVLHEGSIQLPASYEDRTANLFVPADTETTPNLSIARDGLQQGEALAEYVDRQLGLLRQRLPAHKLLNRGPAVLGGGDTLLAGEQIEASYKNGSTTIRQRLSQTNTSIKEGGSCMKPRGSPTRSPTPARWPASWLARCSASR